MSRDRRGDGVQVVGGSNPPCPTNSSPFPTTAARGRYSRWGAATTSNSASSRLKWRITKRHVRIRYTIGDPAQKAIVGRIS